jgi:hypothetical protein
VRFVEYGGTKLVLVDHHEPIAFGHSEFGPPALRYRLAITDNPWDEACRCGRVHRVKAARDLLATDDYDEALAAFHEAEAELLRGELV